MVLPSPSDVSLVHAEREQEARRLDAGLADYTFSDEVRRSLYRYALVRNSWGTTNIDAGPVELSRVSELYEAWAGGVTRTGRILPSEIEVVNYFGLVKGLPTASFQWSADDLLETHGAYFRGVSLANDARAGEWKRADNVVPGPYGVLRTTPKERTAKDAGVLVDWLNGPAQELPTIVRAAGFFHRFQEIHPFGDGNGRAGRFLTLMVLSSGGLPAIRVCPIDDAVNEDREEHYRSLNAADQGETATWLNYFTAQVVQGYRRIHLLGRRLQAVPPHLDGDARSLLEHLYVHKVGAFVPADVRGFFLGTPRRTVTRRLAELQERGLIRGEGRGAGRRYIVTSLHEIETARKKR